MFIEVQMQKDDALSRANFYQQLGCTVQPVVQQTDVTWINAMPQGHSDMASDTAADGTVWVVIATT